LNGPEIWDRLLATAQRGPILVAGGAVRDYILGVPHGDIDVFHTRQTVFQPEGMQIAGFEVDWTESVRLQRLMNDNQAEYAHGPIQVIWCYRGTTEETDGQRVQLICLSNGRTLQEHLDGFDLGINQVCYTDGIQMSKAFIKDWKEQTLTVLNGGPNVDARAIRFRDKFNAAGYNFTIPHLEVPPADDIDDILAEMDNGEVL
jgi:hypothetical protein